MLGGKIIRNNGLLWLLSLLVILTSILNWGNRETTNTGLTDARVNELLPTGSRLFWTGFPQAIPIWVDLNDYWGPMEKPKHIELINGQAEITEIMRNSTTHMYRITANTDTYIRENTYYYPGWTLKVDGILKPIKYQDSKKPGVMHFILDKGEHFVEFTFINTWDRTLSLVVSGLTGLFLVTYIIREHEVVR